MHYSELPTIEKNADNEYVTLARQAINQWILTNNAGDEPLSGDRSDFNGSVTCYSQGFQARNVDPFGVPLIVDGIIGTNTWFALGEYSDEIDNTGITEAGITDLGDVPALKDLPPPDTRGVSPGALSALEIARREIGTMEIPLNSNRGERVEIYQSEGPTDNPTPGLAWCASFVSWCHFHAVDKNAADMPFNYSASSRRIERDLRAAGKFTTIDTAEDLASVRPGDILVWFRCGDLNDFSGHIGLVHHYDPDKGQLFTIEGNRSSRVWAGRYRWDHENADRLIKGLIGYGRI